MKTFTHPQQTCNREECEKRSRYAPQDHWGNCPPKGIISPSASPYPAFGQTMRYNGGTIATDGKWYEAISVPLPAIHCDYEIYSLCGWGLAIRKKENKA